jgi:hypothetical protein
MTGKKSSSLGETITPASNSTHTTKKKKKKNLFPKSNLQLVSCIENLKLIN